MSRVSKIFFATIFAVVVGIVVLVNSFTIVPTGYTGVRVAFGQIDETPLQSGFNWKKPFVEQIKLVNNKQQDIEFTGTVWSESSEQTVVYYENVTITYQISADRSAWILANVTNYKDNLVTANMVSSAIKSASVQLPTDQVTNRNYIEPGTMETLQESLDEKYGEGTITITQVIINNADFEDEYNDAIAERQKAQIEYETAKTENQKKIEAAEAEATVTKTAAQAEADALLIEAQAQAEANELLQASLSGEILTQYMLEKWDGQLPMVTSESDAIFDLSSLLGTSSSGSTISNEQSE